MKKGFTRFLLRFRIGRKIVCWWSWHLAPWKYNQYWRNECDKLRAIQTADMLRIKRLREENDEIKEELSALRRQEDRYEQRNEKERE